MTVHLFIVHVIIDLAKDTSDTAWSSDESVVEYEVVSSNEERNDVPLQMIDGNGSSDTEEVSKIPFPRNLFERKFDVFFILISFVGFRSNNSYQYNHAERG